MGDSSGSQGGISFTGLLFITFLVLKLTKVINWPWIWVFSPLWIGLIVAIVIILIAVIVNALK